MVRLQDLGTGMVSSRVTSRIRPKNRRCEGHTREWIPVYARTGGVCFLPLRVENSGPWRASSPLRSVVGGRRTHRPKAPEILRSRLCEEGVRLGLLGGIAAQISRREHARPRLEDEVPLLLWCEVEQLRRCHITPEAVRLVQVVGRGVWRFGPVGEGEVDHSVDTVACDRGCVYVLTVVVSDNGRILDRKQVVAGV